MHSFHTPLGQPLVLLSVLDLLNCLIIVLMCTYLELEIVLSLLCLPSPMSSGGVRIKSLGSGHTGLKIAVSDLSSLRKRMKESIAAHTVGECCVQLGGVVLGGVGGVGLFR